MARPEDPVEIENFEEWDAITNKANKGLKGNLNVIDCYAQWCGPCKCASACGTQRQRDRERQRHRPPRHIRTRRYSPRRPTVGPWADSLRRATQVSATRTEGCCRTTTRS